MKLLGRLSTIQILVMGYLAVIITVAILLSLPVSSASGQRQPFLDALFLATSGISTTGLTPVDIGSFYSLFGQVVLLTDIQIGGLGYMAFFIFLASFIQTKLSMKSQLVASESVSGAYPRYNLKFFQKVIFFTFLFEFIGGVLLTMCFLKKFPAPKALYFGFFHSINAFCTAGFGLFPDSFISFNKNIVINSTIIFISLIGGIGFYVINEFYALNKKLLKGEIHKHLSIHSKLAIMTTIVLILLGTIVFLVSEKWDQSQTGFDKLMISLFQVVSAQTTDGFNSVDIGKVSFCGLFMLMILMFIGASPGSTGGGIKTTTLGALYLSAKSYLLGRADINFQHRKISEETVKKAVAITTVFFGVCVFDMIIMSLIENFSFERVLFEIISALGNVGLSTGITSSLSGLSKVLLIITMFIGRVGPIAVGFALVGKKQEASFKYPLGDVFVG